MQAVEPTLDLTGSLAAIRCPTLVLVGEDDPVTPPAMAEHIVASLKSSRVRAERLNDCGHGTHRDQPALTEALLREFLSTAE
jgi:proline iminopeptidase